MRCRKFQQCGPLLDSARHRSSWQVVCWPTHDGFLSAMLPGFQPMFIPRTPGRLKEIVMGRGIELSQATLFWAFHYHPALSSMAKKHQLFVCIRRNVLIECANMETVAAIAHHTERKRRSSCLRRMKGNGKRGRAGEILRQAQNDTGLTCLSFPCSFSWLFTLSEPM